ncbi:MAG: CDP-diacylglycerol--glycerol-3-phosphate 3-phosphatidyltransferase [Clostridia bacterium]|jgi:CDP-diacylglycerol--glycerol-3-phosphate 3-phosphatidyltransferase|nr:CDP-diacylglycerol--glycerol-3-phosphate 3-phosphatidyltransferase [Clostridia bacterium]
MNLANKLTLARILLVPIFMVFVLTRIPGGRFIAAAVFILAASTDGLDGYIARRNKQVTRFGKFIDPLADKLLITASLISLVELDLVPAWIAILIISREFAVTGLRTLAVGENVVIAASNLGKLKTVSQVLAISVLLLAALPIPYLGLLGEVLLYVAVVMTVWSGIDYFLKARKVLEKSHKN